MRSASPGPAGAGRDVGRFAACLKSSAGPRARRRVRHAVHVPELGHVPVDRHFLLADDHRAGRQAPGRPDRRAARSAGPAGRRHQDRAPAAGQRAIRRPARLQPGPHAADADRRAAVTAARQRRGADRAAVLPRPHRRAVPPRAGHRLHGGSGDGADRRGDLGDARPPVLLRGAGRARITRTRRYGGHGTSRPAGGSPRSRPRDRPAWRSGPSAGTAPPVVAAAGFTCDGGGAAGAMVGCGRRGRGSGAAGYRVDGGRRAAAAVLRPDSRHHQCPRGGGRG